MIKLKFIRPLLICFFCFSNVVFAQFDIPEIPKEQTSIYDYINLLSATEKQNLEQKLIKYSDTTSTQMVVAIISTTKGENIGLLAPKWAQKWGVGQAKEDNGVFILLAKDDRKIWISPGYGVEDRLIAGIVGELIRNIIIPEFKRDNYYSGLDKGVDAIFEVLTGAYQGQRKSSGSNEIPIGKIIFFTIVFIFFIIAISKNRRNGGGKRSLSSSILDVIILSSMGRRSSGGFGRSSGGGFSGGFGGGFGGGGFSGGGAGGSW
ncbi:TPM domain-containing protein [Flavobacteriaceae bacterium PRS1]|nr:TPM domain-containing protein [Flavobacteriaceae bacterium PRS1]